MECHRCGREFEGESNFCTECTKEIFLEDPSGISLTRKRENLIFLAPVLFALVLLAILILPRLDITLDLLDRDDASSHDPEVEEDHAVVFEGEPFVGNGWTAVIPPSWEGKFNVALNANDEEISTRFFDVANAEAGFGGELVGIFRNLDYAPDYGDYRTLGDDGTYYYYAVYPTDIQCNSNDDALQQEYAAMSEDVEKFLSSIVIG